MIHTHRYDYGWQLGIVRSVPGMRRTGLRVIDAPSAPVRGLFREWRPSSRTEARRTERWKREQPMTAKRVRGKHLPRYQ